jgi:putative transcriptional regulator
VIGRLVLSLSLTYLDVKEQKTTLHNHLTALRVERGLSHQYLADALGISPWTIKYIECGEYYPSLELALRISLIFELPVEEIFTYAY